MEHRAGLSSARSELAAVEREIRKLVQAIKDGVSALSIKDELLTLEGMLSAARDSKRSPDTGDLLVQINLVAGACNRRYLQLWRGAA
jgi:hypothetical protein